MAGGPGEDHQWWHHRLRPLHPHQTRRARGHQGVLPTRSSGLSSLHPELPAVVQHIAYPHSEHEYQSSGITCPTNDPSLRHWHISPKAAAENKTEHGWTECGDLRARVAQRCYCEAVKLCTVSFAGAFTLTPAAIKLHYENNTLWSSRDSPVLWHPGRRELLAVSLVLARPRGSWKEPLLQGVSSLIQLPLGGPGWTGRDSRAAPGSSGVGPWRPTDGSENNCRVCQGPPRETKSFGFEDVACFLLLAFLFWFDYELSMSLACITLSEITPNLQKTSYRPELILWVMLLAMNSVWHTVKQ